jgi:KGK domain
MNNQTRPPLNQIRNIIYLRIKHRIMTDRSKQIIPDSEAVVRCLAPKMLEIFGSHGTFTVSELLEQIKEPIEPKFSLERINAIFTEARSNGSYSHGDFYNDLQKAILVKDNNVAKIANILLHGTLCNLLQPDGKGWQKGTLKICFEFIPEEIEPAATKEQPVETHQSPLDEIRQLSNELASARSIEQN